MIVLDYQDRRPLYEQVEEKFRNLILIGALEPGSRMPSVRQLAMELSINPNTIQRAYMQLEQEGLIYPVKGKGNFIADSEEVRKISKASYTEELKTLIRKGKAMGMEAEELIYIIRECYKEEKPFCTQHTAWPRPFPAKAPRRKQSCKPVWQGSARQAPVCQAPAPQKRCLPKYSRNSPACRPRSSMCTWQTHAACACRS